MDFQLEHRKNKPECQANSWASGFSHSHLQGSSHPQDLHQLSQDTNLATENLLLKIPLLSENMLSYVIVLSQKIRCKFLFGLWKISLKESWWYKKERHTSSLPIPSSLLFPFLFESMERV